MKTKILIIIVVLLIAVAAVTFFLWPKKAAGPMLPGSIIPSQAVYSDGNSEI